MTELNVEFVKNYVEKPIVAELNPEFIKNYL